MKFGTFDFSSMPKSILMSKIGFMEYLLPVRPKLALKLKMVGSNGNLTHLIFKYADVDYNIKKRRSYETFTNF